MKITNQHIQDLYKFTRQHYVKFYDVQTELVDHLANDTEALWQEKPGLTFEEARDISFKKFGVFGFSTIVSKRQQAMGKKYNKILWGFVKEWFRLPKIILTILIFSSLYILFKIKQPYTILWVLLLFGVYTFWKGMRLRKIQKKRFKNTKKQWMLESIIFNTASSVGIMLPINFFNMINLSHLNKSKDPTIFSIVFLAFFLTIMFISIYLSMEVIPKKAEKLLEETYPEYKLTNSL